MTNNNAIWKQKKARLEKIIEKYIFYCLSLDNYPVSTINDNYTFEKLAFDNSNIDPKYATINKKEIKDGVDFINNFRLSFNKLTTEERKLIYWTYIDVEHNYDDRYIANELGYSVGYYYILKKRTITRFAYALLIDFNKIEREE